MEGDLPDGVGYRHRRDGGGVWRRRGIVDLSKGCFRCRTGRCVCWTYRMNGRRDYGVCGMWLAVDGVVF